MTASARRIPVGWLDIGEKEKNAINEVLENGRISEGQKTYLFEKRWAEFIGTKYCLTTNSGTSALITILTCLKYLNGLKKRPKVITSPLTYISDANAIVLSGLEPVFVDIDPKTFCITPETLKRYLENAPDADKHSIVLPVDLMGYPVRLPEIKEIAKQFNLFVVEDAAEAHGSSVDGVICGSGADAGIFSFYIAHNIQAGEMGAITTNNPDIFHLCKKIKTNGRSCDCAICTRSKGVCPGLKTLKTGEDHDPRFFHDVIGYNFKSMEFQPALALTQMESIEKIIKKRRENVKLLNIGLEKFSDVLQLPLHDEHVSYLAYPIVIKNPDYVSRSKIRSELEKKGIETRPLFGCIPTQQPAYAYMNQVYQGRLINAEFAGSNGFYIGCHQHLSTDDIEYTINVFKDVMGSI